MKDVLILAIETSCDETSCAVIKNGKEVLSNIVSSQIKTHEISGGVVPEIASRLHVEQITYVVDQAITSANITLQDLDAIAITKGPGLVGALLVGIETAKTMAYSLDIPLIAVHHIAGHIYANNVENTLEFPLIALVVSGGHSELIYMKDHLQFNVLLKTVDDAVGETFDKVARVLRLPYPGGPHIDRLAKLATTELKFNYKYNDNNEFLTFSGLKTAVINYVNSMRMKDIDIDEVAICNTFQKLAIGQIIDKTKQMIKKHDIKQLVVAGGVAANSYLREQIQTLDVPTVIPSIKYCTDNAVMIGAVAYYQYLKADFSTNTMNANSNLKIEEVYND